MATIVKDTVSNVLQIISDLRGETSTNTDASRIRTLSRMERELAKRKLFKLFQLKDQTQAGDGTNDYTIGDATYLYRSKGLSELFVSTDGATDESKRYQIVDFQKFKNLYNLNNSEKMVYEWYDAANDLWKIHVNPAPEATETITYSYFWMPAKRTSTSDSVVCVNIEALARFTLAEIYDTEDEFDKATDQRNIAEQIISDEIGWENSPHIGQTYAMEAAENQIRGRGIGNY